jgi:excisionase family DNA binding protein
MPATARSARPARTVAPTSVATLDFPSACAYLGIPERYMRRLVNERRIRHYKVGKFVRFAPADLDAFMSANVREPVA